LGTQVTYEYPKQVNWDYLILTIKLYNAFNFRPSDVGWFQGISGSEDKVFVHSERELTTDEKGKLDSLMSDPSSGIYPPKEGETIFIIEDVFDSWAELEKDVGAKIRWIFPNVPDHTKLEVWFDGVLTPSKKNKFLKAYSKLVSEKV